MNHRFTTTTTSSQNSCLRHVITNFFSANHLDISPKEAFIGRDFRMKKGVFQLDNTISYLRERERKYSYR